MKTLKLLLFNSLYYVVFLLAVFLNTLFSGLFTPADLFGVVVAGLLYLIHFIIFIFILTLADYLVKESGAKPIVGIICNLGLILLMSFLLADISAQIKGMIQILFIAFSMTLTMSKFKLGVK